MTRGRETHNERRSPYVEPWANIPLRVHRKDEGPEILDHDAVEDAVTFAEDPQDIRTLELLVQELQQNTTNHNLVQQQVFQQHTAQKQMTQKHRT
ncbi:hypothetical protein INS49_010555 [Diaporthe citri]|uniref:uncharacterized protein n=1 Tax=Diaporthe citri TaxID=83186 RepID=UPI001C80BFB6|nr:uncharacterized protein INS49_010555 [Diaporthe citri]KAG6362325.1 hypothetical protein INS49_010555 [Diaporthe citri]